MLVQILLQTKMNFYKRLLNSCLYTELYYLICSVSQNKTKFGKLYAMHIYLMDN